MHAAKFPVHRDMAGFDFEVSPVDRKLVGTLATAAFTDDAHNVVLVGGPGTGKTHLATAIGVAYGVMWLPALAATPPALALLYFMRNTGVAAALGSVILFVTAVLLGNSIPLALAVALLPALALARQRLLPTPGVQRNTGTG